MGNSTGHGKRTNEWTRPLLHCRFHPCREFEAPPQAPERDGIDAFREDQEKNTYLSAKAGAHVGAQHCEFLYNERTIAIRISSLRCSYWETKSLWVLVVIGTLKAARAAASFLRELCKNKVVFGVKKILRRTFESKIYYRKTCGLSRALIWCEGRQKT